MKLSTKVLLGLLAILLAAQLFQIDKENPVYNLENDLLAQVDAPGEVKTILKQACYDCHSYETKYPWYTSVAPLSWWIDEHIQDGRKHFNFSEWGNYDLKKKKHKLEELIHEVEEGEMPLNSYTWAHSEANLSEEQIEALISWTKATIEDL
ncbi:heme-binding domain-containing protein [Fulvivirga lutimaris]|uniref:heme-binding domain-containing protein n=1 Tax=Fulvivirga lutimaris TaxID=1819566 RepID=UPI0012BD5396|nr:heme-binding domain-containing protein [Fulvivirga lutimaris]MTI41419.1 cytochrome C [Fulvivirga lutimaris]